MKLRYLFFFILFFYSCNETDREIIDREGDIPTQFIITTDSLSITPVEIRRSKETVVHQDSEMLITVYETDWRPEPETSLRTSWGTTTNTTTWTVGDQIGIFMNNTGGTTLSANIRYNVVTGGVSSSSLTPNATPIYFPFPPSQNVNFYAYYPYLASASTTTYSYTIPTTQSTAAQLGSADFLYATPYTTNALSPTVPLTFNHVMSMISFQVKTLTGAATLSQITLSGQSVTNKGTLDITNGTVTPTTATFSPTAIKAQSINSTTAGYIDLIMNPCTFAGSTNLTGLNLLATIKMSTPSLSYISNLGLTSGTITFASGRRYVFTITILSL